MKPDLRGKKGGSEEPGEVRRNDPGNLGIAVTFKQSKPYRHTDAYCTNKQTNKQTNRQQHDEKFHHHHHDMISILILATSIQKRRKNTTTSTSTSTSTTLL